MELPDLEKIIFRFRYPIVVLLAGLLFVGGGAFLWRAGVFEGAKVEVIDSDPVRELSPLTGQVVVEISGAVEKPGVYEMLASDRVERLLIASGGLSAEADRDWVDKNLNRAAKLIDGQKIYVPTVGEVTPLRQGSEGQGSGFVAGSVTGLININTATAVELDGLWGIGPARAQAIIEARPFSSIEELLSKKIVPSNVYERIRDEITAP
ncbi:MAG: helix-hairpin-helix domain-containing protein [bacterium]|nr:helix-hairpin-helix domain-containing protein [bacterium]